LPIARIVQGVLIALFVTLVSVGSWNSFLSPPNSKTINQSDQTTQHAGSTSAADERIAAYTWWLAAFTCALVVVSAVQIRFLIRTDKTARITAEASGLNARTATAVELPIVFLSKIELFQADRLVIQGDPFIKLVEAVIPPKECRLALTFRNYGRTPARAEQLCIAHVIANELPPEPEYFLVTLLSTGTIIGADREISGDPFGRIIYLSDAERGAIEAKGARLWVYGMIQFRDFLGKPHTHRFCAKWWGFDDPNEAPWPSSFVEDGPESYRKND
jgi:hypothetical protein